VTIQALHVIIVSTTNCDNSALLTFRCIQSNLIEVTSATSSLERTSFVSCECNAIHPTTSANWHASYIFTIFEIKGFPGLIARISSSVWASSDVIAIVSSIYNFYAIYKVSLRLSSELFHKRWGILLGFKVLDAIQIIEFSGMGIYWAFRITLFQVLIPWLIFWTFNNRKVGIKIYSLIVLCKVNILLEFSENDIKSL
jgi:hypothetical protein